MPQITHVKKARPRYERVPVIAVDTGQPLVVPVNRTAKNGRAVTMAVTRGDTSRPLPPHDCDHCRQPIEVGTPYKRISPKSGPYGGRTLRRHEACPTWHPWDYSNSLSARLAQVEYEFTTEIDGADSPDTISGALQTAADTVREIAEEKRESAAAIEEGFQHPTPQSEELSDIADQLEEWAGEIENVTVPDLPEPEDEDCEDCDGTGKADGEPAETAGPDCENCDGTGQVTPDGPTEDQMDDWRSEVEDETSVVGEPPV